MKNKSKRMVFGVVLVVGFVLLSNVILIRNCTIALTREDAMTGFVVSDLDVTRSTIPDSCVYPATYDIEYNTSFLIRGNYAPLINVSENQAINAAFVFFEEYLPDVLTTGLRAASSDEGFWPGSPMLITDFWPRWAMTLVSDSIEAAVFVNALSGKVVNFALYSYNTSVYPLEPIESAEAAENHTIDFFQSQNYTLLPDAVYDGISLLSEGKKPYYTVIFHQEVGEIPISFGEIYLEIDSTYGLIEHFSYRWIEIEEIPVERVLPVAEINDIILDTFNDTSEITIVSTELCFNRIGFSPDTPEFVMQLVYELKLVRFNSYIYTIDALSGEILGVDVLMSSSFLIVYSPFFRVVAILLIAVVSSSISYKFVKKRQHNTPIHQF
ncbi:MAG: hypothetical protein ACW97A_11970 [Candidatus Thorarchaeota archaeon]